MKRVYLIPRRQEIEKSLALSERWNACFEYNDFVLPAVLDDDVRVGQLIDFYKGLSRDRSEDTLHGAFLDVTVHSEDPKIREVSGQRVRQCMEIGAKLGVRGLVFHTNAIPNFRTASYLKHWVEANAEFWSGILEEYAGLEIYMENMFDEEPLLLADLMEQMSGKKDFGVCLDFGHAGVFGKQVPMQEWFETLHPYVRHMHINDNDLKLDLHCAVGDGLLDWGAFKSLTGRYRMECSVLVEVSEIEKQRKSLEYMSEKGIYPFQTGGRIC